MPTPQEIASFRLFLKKGAIFVAPFLLYAALIVAIDPFNYFGVSQLVDRQIKWKTAGKLHYSLWKTLAFLEDPRPNVVFGDSRMALIDPAKAEKLTGERWYNFSYGGGTIPEMADSFWFADQHVELERVYLGVSFINVAKKQSMNRFTESQAIRENPLLYLTNRIVAKAAVYASLSQIQGKPIAIETPPMNREEFWKYQLGEATATHYRSFEYSLDHMERLREVAEYCAEKGIGLTLIIPPSHVDLQAKIDEFGHTETAERFGRDLRTLGRVVDFDFPNGFTSDRENFGDPYHFRPTLMILEQILSESPDPTLTR